MASARGVLPMKGRMEAVSLESSRARASVPGARDDGFTLVELMIIMLILAILASIIVFAVQSLEGSTAASACLSDYKTIETAQETYRGQVGVSADSFADLLGTAVGLTGQEVGPWLKEAPSTTHGYVIGFDPTAGPKFGDITVASTNPVHAAADGNANCAYA